MKKFDTLLSDHKNAVERISRLMEEIKDLEAKKAAYNAEAEKAAFEDNVSEYKRCRGMAEDVESTISVKKVQVEKLSAPAAKKDLEAAWTEVKKDAEQNLAGKLKTYKGALTNIHATVTAIADICSDTAAKRAVLEEIGAEKDLGDPFVGPNFNDMVPVINALYRSGVITSDETARLGGAIRSI